MVQRAARALGAQAGSLFLLEGDPPMLEARVLNQPAEGPLTVAPPLIISPGEGTAGWVALHGQILRVDHAPGDSRFKPYDYPGSKAIESLLCVPLRADGRIFGVIDVVNRPGGFNAEAEVFLGAVADELAIALKNAWLVRTLEKEKLALEVMREVSHTLLSTLRVEEVLERIVVGLGRLIEFDAVGIFLVRADGTIEHAIERGLRSGSARSSAAEGGGGAHRLVDLNRSAGDRARRPGRRSLHLGARLDPIGDGGAAHLARQGDRRLQYRERRARRLQPRGPEAAPAFADSAAVALEVARLHEEAVRSRRLEEDLAIARQIQLSFLPQSPPKMKGIDLAGLNVPSLEVGGDFYTFVDVAPGQLGVGIADVAGKGISAGLIMASFRASLLAEVRNNYSITTILSKVNRLLIESTEPSHFVTALYGVLDYNTRRFTYSCAGHYPGLLLREDGSIQDLIEGAPCSAPSRRSATRRRSPCCVRATCSSSIPTA